MPPESPLLLIPGTSDWMPVAFLDDGIAAMTSRSTMVWTRALWTSNVGDSPVTVTVSSSVPTRNSALTVATKSPLSTMPSRLTVLKPGSENVMV
jgi:hypothetical protein